MNSAMRCTECCPTRPTLAISGTHVAGDFVEFPSQLYEHWMSEPEMLRRFALHYKAGEPMPEALLSKLIAARQFNQGWARVSIRCRAGRPSAGSRSIDRRC